MKCFFRELRKISAPLFAAVLLLSPLRSAAQSLPQNIAEAFQIASGVPKLSGRMVFSAAVEGRDQLFVLDLDSAVVRPLNVGSGNNSFPSWSPDGRKVVFTSDRDGNKEIYLAQWSGEGVRRLTNSPHMEDYPSWGTDGKSVIYSASQGNDADGKDVINIFSLGLEEGAKPVQLTQFTSGRAIMARMSRDGSLMAYTTNRFWPGWDICTTNLKSKKERCILEGQNSFCRSTFANQSDKLVFSVGDVKRVDLGVYEFSSGSSSRITQLPRREYDAIWSPDDRYIAFTHEIQKEELFGVQIYDFQHKKSVPLLQSIYSIRYLSWNSTKTFDLEAERINQTPP